MLPQPRWWKNPAFVVAILFVAPPGGDNPRKAAEGAYGEFDTWTLSALADQSQFVADINMKVYASMAANPAAGPSEQTEKMRMAGDFTMLGFQYETRNFRGFGDGALDCTVNPQSLECTSTFPGPGRGKGTINVAGGYATQFGVHVALLDMPWFFTTLVAQSDRDREHARTMGIVTIAFDGQTPDTLVTGGGADAEVRYMGEEAVRVLGRPLHAHQFRIRARTYEAVVWTTKSGLLLAADWGGMRIELTRYRQWTALIPELPVEEVRAP